MKDPFVEEIRKYRLEHTRKFQFDLHAICNDLRKYQEELYNVSEIDLNKRFVNKHHLQPDIPQVESDHSLR